jgi:hypothetical protein
MESQKHIIGTFIKNNSMRQTSYFDGWKVILMVERIAINIFFKSFLIF